MKKKKEINGTTKFRKIRGLERHLSKKKRGKKVFQNDNQARKRLAGLQA